MSFYKAVLTVGGLTMGSRILGFIRDILTAAVLGAGPVADAFFVALKLPNFFRRITAEGAFSVSFVPLFAGELEKNGKEDAKRFAEEAQAIMLAVLVPFTVVMIVAMPWLLYVIAPGFTDTPARYDMALEMSRITFPYILLMSLASLLGGVMNSFDRFGPFAAAPMLFNLSLIVALLGFGDMAESGGHAMAWGVAAAGVLQLGWMVYFCRRMGIRLKLRRPRLTRRIRVLFRRMGPGVFGASIAQVNIFIDMILASLLPVGAISFLYYADRLYQLPLSVIGIAIGTALLPMLTRALKSEETGAASRLFSRGIEAGLILALPATVAYFAMAETLMQALFNRGAFTAENAHQSSLVLMAYALGLPAFIVSRVLGTVFFAHGDTATPVKYAVVCAVLNTLLALAFITPLQHVGIALATGLTAWVNFFLLLNGVRKRRLVSAEKTVRRRAWKILAASLLMGAAVAGLDRLAMPYFMDSGEISRLTGLGLLVLSGVIVYGVLLRVMGVLTPAMVKELFPKRKKQDTIGDVQQFGQ